MQRLGHTRSAYSRDHYIQTPDTFIRAPLPGMKRATAVVHVGPAVGAGFTQYTAEMETGGTLGPTELQRFVYVLDGSVEVSNDRLSGGEFAYIPPGLSYEVRAASASRVAVIERKPGGATPEFFYGDESQIPSQTVLGDEHLQVRTLIPDRQEFNFAMNTMTYQPGAALPMVEMHVMEHGLLMLEGGGIYRLGDSWYPVSAGDFIYMAPFCLQWFGALGKQPAKYLLYKDWNQHPHDR